jgi:Ca-activated chloride channel family protein
MTLRLLISLNLLLLFAAHKTCAQLAPADDFFNGGAQFYISNNIPAAKERVEKGLKFYPDDEKLKKLEELLKQQQQSQNSQSQQPQQNQSQKNQQQPQNSQGQQKSNQSDQKNDEQQKQPEPQKSSAEKKGAENPERKNGEGQPVAPGQMTPEEAKKLLDAQKGDEQVLQLKPQGKPENNNRPVKDW